MSNEKGLSFKDGIGCVYRHNRLFNYLISPISFEGNLVKCHAGNNIVREIPMDYFKRDWKRDNNIDYDDLNEKMRKYPENTPFTVVFDEEYEIDDGSPHSYIHFNDDFEEKMVQFPSWRVTTCTKAERVAKINPFTMIMSAKDNMEEQIQNDLDIINTIRKENEFIKIDDFQGFEFGLIKYLEKKYLRIV